MLARTPASTAPRKRATDCALPGGHEGHGNWRGFPLVLGDDLLAVREHDAGGEHYLQSVPGNNLG